MSAGRDPSDEGRASPAARLRAAGLSPKKGFGQNFLVDPTIVGRIAELATTPLGGTVVELGAGLGALTRPLLARASRVVAVERDRDLVPLLAEAFSEERASGRLRIDEADAQTHDWAAALEGGPRPHVVAGNLPYLITGRLIERATGLADRVDRVVFMVQAEVADRLAASPGSRTYGALSVFVQAAFQVEKAIAVRPGAFYPRPEVSSAVVLLVPRPAPLARETEAFRQVVKRAFGERRKTLRNAWKGLFGLSPEGLARLAAEAGISLDARGETLSVSDFARVAALGEALPGGPGAGRVG